MAEEKLKNDINNNNVARNDNVVMKTLLHTAPFACHLRWYGGVAASSKKRKDNARAAWRRRRAAAAAAGGATRAGVVSSENHEHE